MNALEAERISGLFVAALLNGWKINKFLLTLQMFTGVS
jgi:hypothetical protein